MSAQTLETRELTTADRCDACGAQAYVWVKLPSGGELFFCGHHGHKNEAKLREQAEIFEDQTDRLK